MCADAVIWLHFVGLKIDLHASSLILAVFLMTTVLYRIFILITFKEKLSRTIFCVVLSQQTTPVRLKIFLRCLHAAHHPTLCFL